MNAARFPTLMGCRVSSPFPRYGASATRGQTWGAGGAIFSIFTLCAALALAVPAARAATLTVTSAADDGTAGTLRQVKAAAQDGDTIAFALPPRTVITLTQGVLPVGKVLHIVGPTGGGIIIDGNVTVQLFAITAGTAANPVTLSNLTLRHGSNPQGLGGGFSNRGTVSLLNCTLADNSAHYGGGFYNTGTAALTNCVLSGNSTTLHQQGYGGGVYNSSGTLALTNCTLADNSAAFLGGGLSSISGTVTLRRCTFSRNHAQYAGAVYVDSSASATVINCVFARNRAIYYGGGIYHYSGPLTLTNCTFTGNSTKQSGGALFNYGNPAILTNDILYGDSAKNGSEIFTSTNALIVARFCDIQGGFAGTGNIDADPQFVSSTVPHDLRLQASSPCINAGTPDSAPPDDRDGSPRDAAPDMGAFEFQP